MLKHLKRHGTRLRRGFDTIRQKKRLPYGTGIADQQLKEDKKEMETVQRMREKGFSYWKIADALNIMGVPTKTRKGPWHARSVQQILDRVGASDSPKHI